MLKNHIRRCIFGGVLGLLAFGLYALLAPKQYEGRAELIVGAALNDKFQPRPTAVPDDVLQILNEGQPQSYETEIELLRSEGVFMESLQKVAQVDNDPSLLLPENAKKLYLLYDVENQPMSTMAAIKTRGPSPKIAADLANAIMDSYDAGRKDRLDRSTKAADNYLDGRLGPALDALNKAESKLAAFKHRVGMIDPNALISTASQKDVALTELRTNIDSAYRGAVAEAESLKQQLAGVPKNVPGSVETIRNPEIDRVTGALNDAIAKLARDSADFDSGPVIDEDRRVVKAYEDSLSKAQKADSHPGGSVQSQNPVYQGILQQLAITVAKRDSLNRQLAVVESDLAKNTSLEKNLPENQKEAAQLQREVDLDDLTYRQLKTVSDDLNTRVVAGGNPTVKVLSATQDEDVAAPNLLKYSAFGLIAGLALGLLYSFSIESLRLRVYDSSQVAELTGVPVVAALPVTRAGGPNPLELFARKQDAAVPEALKYVAFTSLADGVSKYRSVMFTEGGNALGGQTAALQYAIVLSETGLRVALVDADLRRKSLSKAFNMENAVGVADLVEKKLLPGSSEDLLKTTVHENLFFLPAGVGAASAITSAPSQSVDAFMEYLLGSVDVVVISAPPCDQYADASRLASLVDQVFLMIAAQRTSLPAVPRARDLLLNAGAKDVKVMMSGADRGDDGMTIQPRHAPAA